jgi:hypothetical protein
MVGGWWKASWLRGSARLSRIWTNWSRGASRKKWTQEWRSLGCRCWRTVERYFDILLDSRTVIEALEIAKNFELGKFVLLIRVAITAIDNRILEGRPST